MPHALLEELDLSARAVLARQRLGKGKTTPENRVILRFHTASATNVYFSTKIPQRHTPATDARSYADLVFHCKLEFVVDRFQAALAGSTIDTERKTGDMNDEQLAEELEKRKAVVVHFSHHANMREGGTFPEDLQAAINDGSGWPLSCSVLFPGHSMTPCGSVGVIFKPSVADVISVWNSDSGSHFGKDGVDRSFGSPLDAQSFQSTFQINGAYNEWRVRADAEVVGIFVLNPCEIFAKKSQNIWDPRCNAYIQDIAMQSINLEDVFAAFPNRQVFTLGPDGLVEVQAPSVRTSRNTQS